MAGYTTFIQEDETLKDEKPYSWFGPGTSIPSTNFTKKETCLTLVDVRSLPDSKQPTLDSHGFCFLKHWSKDLQTLNEDPKIYQPYVDEVAVWLKTVMPRASLIVPYSIVIRGPSLSGYASSSHVDLVPFTAWWYAQGLLTDEEQKSVLSGEKRLRLMNVWRPRVYPVENNGLALLDPNTVKNFEMEHADVLIPGSHADEFAQVKNDPEHRWMWMSKQTPDDAIVFCKYDTHPPKGKSPIFGLTSHGAVRADSAPQNTKPRQSVETSWIFLEPAPYTSKPQFADLSPPDTRRQPWKGIIDMAPRPKYQPPQSMIGQQRWEQLQKAVMA